MSKLEIPTYYRVMKGVENNYNHLIVKKSLFISLWLVFTSCTSPLGQKEISMEFTDLTNEIKRSVKVDLDTNEIVYKREILITGELLGSVLLNHNYTLSNKVDTSYMSDWYQEADSLIIQPIQKSVNGELKVTFRFFYQKNDIQ